MDGDGLMARQSKLSRQIKRLFGVKKSPPSRTARRTDFVPSSPRSQVPTWREVAPAKKSKRDKRGFHRFDYYGVTGREFMQAMRSGKYRGEKISRKGSSISEFVYPRGGSSLTRSNYSLAIKIPKKDRIVL